MNTRVEVTQVENGYIIESQHGTKQVYTTLDEVLTRMLAMFEGRSPSFSGGSYGEVRVRRETPSDAAMNEVTG